MYFDLLSTYLRTNDMIIFQQDDFTFAGRTTDSQLEGDSLAQLMEVLVLPHITHWGPREGSPRARASVLWEH